MTNLLDRLRATAKAWALETKEPIVTGVPGLLREAAQRIEDLMEDRQRLTDMMLDMNDKIVGQKD